MSPVNGSNYAPGSVAFGTTHWTVILEAAGEDPAAASEALARIYQDYWYPLYGYVCRRGHSPAEAEDLTQSFFFHLIHKHSLQRVSRNGGRFRSFLLHSVDNFLANEWDHDHAQKRGEGRAAISLDAEHGEARFSLEPSDESSPAVLYEQQWAFTLLEHVMERLRAECEASSKGELFRALQPHLQGERSGTPYVELAGTLQMSVGAIKVAMHRLRRRYVDLLREEVQRTVSAPGEVDDELRYLIDVVARAACRRMG